MSVTIHEVKTPLVQVTKESNVKSLQIERINNLLPGIKTFEKKARFHYAVLYYLTAVVSFLTAGVGATLIAQLSQNQDWGQVTKSVMAVITVLQTFIKVFGLEDRKNKYHQHSIFYADLHLRLLTCIARLSDISLVNGAVPPDQANVWNKIVELISTVDLLSRSLDLNTDLSAKIGDLVELQTDLQRQGITGLTKLT